MSWTCGDYITNCHVGEEYRDGIRFNLYDDECLRFNEEMCQAHLPELCRVKCYRMGRRGSSQIEYCVDKLR